MREFDNNSLQLLEEFEAAVRDAIGKAGLSPTVSVGFAYCGAATRAVELDSISANPMRQGHGSKAMAVIAGLADSMGVVLLLRVANENDDFQVWEDDDPARPPTEAELIGWYGRFGFEVLELGFDTHMRRIPEMVPTPPGTP